MKARNFANLTLMTILLGLGLFAISAQLPPVNATTSTPQTSTPQCSNYSTGYWYYDSHTHKYSYRTYSIYPGSCKYPTKYYPSSYSTPKCYQSCYQSTSYSYYTSPYCHSSSVYYNGQCYKPSSYSYSTPRCYQSCYRSYSYPSYYYPVCTYYGTPQHGNYSMPGNYSWGYGHPYVSCYYYNPGYYYSYGCGYSPCSSYSYGYNPYSSYYSSYPCSGGSCYGYSGYGYPTTYNPPTPTYHLGVSTDPPNIASVTGAGNYTSGTSASFSVSQNIVDAAPGTRYVFTRWSGDYSGQETSGKVTVDGAKNVVAVYQLQHRLDVSPAAGAPANAPLPQGAGWYNADETVTLNGVNEMLGSGDGSRLVFSGWNVDGNLVQSGTSLQLRMDSPHTVSPVYKNQYYLKVLTDQGVASGEGWYDSGTNADIYVTTPPSPSFGVQILFDGWRGDVNAGTQSATVQMDRAKTAIATWHTDYTILYLTMGGGIAALLGIVGALAFVTIRRSRQSAPAAPAAPKHTRITQPPSSSPSLTTVTPQ